MSTTAEAIRETLMSPNVMDSNWEAANVVDVLDRLARNLYNCSQDGDANIVTGLYAIAQSIDKLGEVFMHCAERLRVER